MLIHYFKKPHLFFTLLLMSTSSFGEMYKWVDEKGQTHYSQQAPKGHQAEIIKAPPPPAIDPNVAQQEIDTLIEKQDGSFEANEKERQRIAEEAAEQKKIKEYCRINKNNLQQLQDNPGRKLLDHEDNIIRLTEEERQQEMTDIRNSIAEHCQQEGESK